jgi:phage gp29-like protein
VAAAVKAQRRATTVKQRKNGKTAKSSTIATPLGYASNGGVRRYTGWRTLPRIAAITPQYLESVLWGALGGFSVQQWELFNLMLDTWPELGTCVQELSYGVERKQVIIEPHHEEDQEPSASAVDKSKFVWEALHAFDPNFATDENDLRGTISELLEAWICGQTVLQIFWKPVEGLGTVPRATQWVHPNNYGWDKDFVLGLRADRYPNSTSVQPVADNLIPFSPDRFLIGIHKAKWGPLMGCALLRPLAWWWCAANFSSDWLLNLGQLFGIPWRIAYYDPNAPPETIAAIDTMLQNMGSSTWARFPVGTTIDLKEPGREGSDHSPQGELLDRADRYARSLILGQTMTGTHGTTGKGGGQAFGRVEANVKEDRVDAAGKFVTGVINDQLVKAILRINYGNDDESPRIRLLEEEEGGLVEAQRDTLLTKSGLPIGINFIYKKYGIPAPAEDEELLSAPSTASPFGGGDKAGTKPDATTADPQSTEDQAAAEQSDEQPAQAKLMQILAIEDEALFSKELTKLAETLNAS